LRNFALVLIALAAVGALALALEMRGDVSPAGARLAAEADRLAARLDPAAPRAEREELLLAAGGAARQVGPAGGIRLQTGPEALWARTAAAWPERVATTGVSGWRMVDGAVEAERPLASGAGAVRLRAALPPGAGLGDVALAPALAAVGGLALLAGGLGALRARRTARRIARFAAVAETVAATRAPPAIAPDEEPAEWRRLAAALVGAGARAGDLQRGVDARFDALGAVLGPLQHPIAARTPTRARLRNEALDRLVSRLPPADADAVESAVREGLAADGPAARRLTLGDGRALEVEAWSVPGGRLVAIGERTEQQRLAAVRRQMSGAAARHLQAPVSEIQAVAAELSAEGHPSAQPAVRRILASANRMERLVASILRGTAHDPRARPVTREPVGLGGTLWGLARAWDRRLKALGLRLEPSIADDVPAVHTDPMLLEEILTELIANAAKFTGRGGTINVKATLRADGGVRLAVVDSGAGVPPDEVAHITEPFIRGRSAAALPGAGLGLGVASALAGRLGGRLTMEPGPGGRATLDLPPPPAAPQPPAAAPAEPAELMAAS
jgi:signal transduction histidine kinase